MSIKAFISSAFSNRSVITHRSLSLWQIGLLLLVSFMMVAVPFIIGRFNVGDEYLDTNFPQFSEDFALALQSTGCNFSLDANNINALTCEVNDRVVAGSTYTIYLLPTDGRQFARNAIIFFPQSLRVTYDGEQVLEGPYLFGNASFAQIRETMFSNAFNSTPQRYAMNILRNLNLFTLPADILFIYISLAIQYTFYLFVISFLMWWLYLKRGFVKLPFKEVIAMLVVVMFWTALPTTMVGFFTPVIASVLFTIGYVTRIVFLYIRLTHIIRV